MRYSNLENHEDRFHDTLRALVEKAPDADILREMNSFAAGRAMEIGARTSAGHGEKSADRLVQRNGSRARDWQTRAVTVELRIPQVAQACPELAEGDSYFPGFLEPRWVAEKALCRDPGSLRAWHLDAIGR